MRHTIKTCDNRAQDQWATLYIAMAKSLIAEYALEGKGIIREGVRRYARGLAKERKTALLESGCKTNLETFFTDGFGFPCGDRCHKEWIRCTDQELFLNVVRCPYADTWSDDAMVGRMFCEEYYPVLVHEGISEKAQINLGMCLLSGRDNICRHSIYLRPANLPPEKRAECFSSFDITCSAVSPAPDWTPDYDALKLRLVNAFVSAAADKLGQDCANKVLACVKVYAQTENDVFLSAHLEV